MAVVLFKPLVGKQALYTVSLELSIMFLHCRPFLQRLLQEVGLLFMLLSPVKTIFSSLTLSITAAANRGYALSLAL